MPVAPTINGSSAAVQNLETLSYTPNTGGTYGGRYEGAKAAVLAKFYVLMAAGWHVTYECDASPVARVTFDTPTGAGGTVPTTPNADYTDNFQISRNTVQKELLASDHPMIANVGKHNLLMLKKLFANPGLATYVEPSTIPVQFINAGVDQNCANYLFQMFQSGVKSVEVKQPILRVTRITNPLYDAPFNMSRLDRVLSTATMIADSGVPSNFAVDLYNLADRLSQRTAMTGIFATRTDELKLVFGWLKDTVTMETMGTSRNQYVMEYKFGLWDFSIYDAVL